MTDGAAYQGFMKKVFNIIYYIFVVAIALIALLLVFSLFPIKGNYQVKIVQSGSMEPTIETGSIVIIKPQTSYEVGNIITFGEDNRKAVPTTHRIVESKTVNGDTVFKTKGDANNGPDFSEISQSKVIGKVLFSVPYLGFVVDFVKKPIGFALVVIVPAVLIILDELKNIYGEIRKRKNNKN